MSIAKGSLRDEMEFERVPNKTAELRLNDEHITMEEVSD